MSTPTIINGTTYQMLPDMDPEQYGALKADIARQGVLVPIEIDEDGNILDGHHRFRAWSELAKNEPPPVIVRDGLNGDEKRLHARKANVLRRHLTREQMRVIIEQQLKETPERSNRFIASALGVDHKTVGAVRRGGAASGEIPQLEKTRGVDGKARRQGQRSEKRVPYDALAAFASTSGTVVKRADLPDDLKLMYFNAGMMPEQVIVVTAPEPEPMDPAVERIWIAFGRFLVEQGWSADHAGEHISWLIGKDFTPEEWFGAEGDRFRQTCGMQRASSERALAWASFDKQAAADAGWPT